MVIKVLVNDGSKDVRKVVEAEVIHETATTYRVRLSDGKCITRKKNRDIPEVSDAKTK